MYRVCIQNQIAEQLGSILAGMHLDTAATEAAFIDEVFDRPRLYP